MSSFDRLRAGLLALLLLLSPLAAGAESPPPADSERNGGRFSLDPMVTVEQGGVRFNSGNRRDPFLNPVLLRRGSEERVEEVFRGQLPPGIRGMLLDQVRLLGVSIRETGRTAIFHGTDKRAYFLREGDRFLDGYLKRIERDSVLLIREGSSRTKETAAQEVWKRLRTP